MGQTRKTYPTRWLAISLEDGGTLASGHERKRIGDVTAVVRRHEGWNGPGLKEMERYLFLNATGLEEEDFGRLVESAQHEKRRWSISLSDLAALNPRFSVQAALDPQQRHQPFAVVDLETGELHADAPAVDVSSLLRDSETGGYGVF